MYRIRSLKEIARSVRPVEGRFAFSECLLLDNPNAWKISQSLPVLLELLGVGGSRANLPGFLKVHLRSC